MAGEVPNTIMMAVGPIYFSMDFAAYQELQRDVEYRWPVMERIGWAPARQFIGKGDDTIELTGYIHTLWGRGNKVVGAKCLDTIRALADQGLPQKVFDGFGKVFGTGLYCILSVSEKQTNFLPGGGGIPKRQEFTIKLGNYGDEAANDPTRRAVVTPSGVSVPRNP